jgi:hypothetical protein
MKPLVDRRTIERQGAQTHHPFANLGDAIAKHVETILPQFTSKELEIFYLARQKSSVNMRHIISRNA